MSSSEIESILNDIYEDNTERAHKIS